MRSLLLMCIFIAACDDKAEPVDSGCDPQLWFMDADGDGYGAGEGVEDCEAGTGYVADDTDCDDAVSAVNPGAEEVCDGVDNNCDADIDEGVTQTVYADQDGDGFGDSSAVLDVCDIPPGYVLVAGDCDDTRADVAPGAAELCDHMDNNCNGSVDEDVVVVEWYKDADGDGYGDPSEVLTRCAPPSGYVANADDCDDTDSSTYPGEDERCFCADRIDNDGDGLRDCADPDCGSYSACSEAACQDGADNDRDGLIDCEDGDCATDLSCYESSCFDNVDNDDDGDVDCIDNDCWGTTSCTDTIVRARVRSAAITGRRVQQRSYTSHYSFTTSGALGYTGQKTTRSTSRRYTATGVQGTIARIDPSASTRTTCTWQVSEAVWSGQYDLNLEQSMYSFDLSIYAQPFPIVRSGFMLSSGCPMSTSSAAVFPLYLGWKANSLSLGEIIQKPFSPDSVIGCGQYWYNPGASRSSSTFSSWSAATSSTRGLFTKKSWEKGHSANIWATASSGDWFTAGACGP